MTKGELIAMLADFNDDDEVMVECPSKDFWGTVTANEINRAEDVAVVYSDYHRTMKVVEDEENYDGEAPLKRVVLLS